MARVSNKDIMEMISKYMPVFEEHIFFHQSYWMQDIEEQMIELGFKRTKIILTWVEPGLYSVCKSTSPNTKVGAVKYEKGMFSSAWYSYWSRTDEDFKTKVIAMGDIGEIRAYAPNA